jgi:hypothetical protein
VWLKPVHAERLFAAPDLQYEVLRIPAHYFIQAAVNGGERLSPDLKYEVLRIPAHYLEPREESQKHDKEREKEI